MQKGLSLPGPLKAAVFFFFFFNAVPGGFTDVSVIHAVTPVCVLEHAHTHMRGRRGEVAPATKGVCVFMCVFAGWGGPAIKRQHAVSHEVLMPRISCSNVIHIPSVIQPAPFDV